ncbi:MAG: fluoride efflux transporter CrcB [Bacteroidales bacterium]|nr:fluoride efflux transporter CrcB [Bacteroidales bacterium]
MNIFYKLLLVFLGAGLGGSLRWLLSSWLNGTRPIGTFLVNVLGCFLVGLLSGLLVKHCHQHEPLTLLLVAGFCGGFTTFSTFVNENFLLLQTHHPLSSLLYVLSSLIAGLIACWLGRYLA